MSDRGYANPDLLMTPEELHARLGNSDICVVDVRPTHEFAIGHIPGAIHLDLYGISLNNTGSEAFDAFMWTIGYLFGSRGIGSDQTAVFYEIDSGMRAARGFWLCEYLGHRDVHVLDGGVKAWQAAGYEVTTRCMIPESATFSPDAVPAIHIGADEIRGSLSEQHFVPLDTRSEDEHYGRAVRAARGGTIPGSVHLEYVSNLDETGRFKPGDALREMYERAGVTPDQTIACY